MSDDPSLKNGKVFTSEITEVLEQSYDLISNNLENIKTKIICKKWEEDPIEHRRTLNFIQVQTRQLDIHKIHLLLKELVEFYISKARCTDYTKDEANYWCRTSICMQDILLANNMLKNRKFTTVDDWYTALEETLSTHFPSYCVKSKLILVPIPTNNQKLAAG